MALQEKSKSPKDIEYHAEYEPDMSLMVKSLRVLLETNGGGKCNDQLHRTT